MNLLIRAAVAFLATVGTAQAQTVPNPVLHLTGTENYTAGGKNWVRYRFDVANKESFPEAMFAPAPGLPPVSYTHLTLPTKRIV